MFCYGLILLKLNSDKCKVLSIWRSNKNCSRYDYSLDNAKIECVRYLKDFEVLYEINFEFGRYTDTTVSKALKMIGFILDGVLVSALCLYCNDEYTL